MRVRRGRGEAGFALIELLVALFIFSIALGMASELYISNLRSTSNLREQIQMLDDSDQVKSWLASTLAAADTPPVSGDWETLEVTANGNCYKISLDTATHQLQEQSASSCASVDSATATTLTSFDQNTSAAPLFTFEDSSGTSSSTPSSSTTKVVVNLVLDDPNDSLPQQSRTMTFGLGAIYGPPSSVGSADIVDGSVGTAKVAPGALQGSDFADGSIPASKLTVDARKGAFALPLAEGDSGTWTAASSWGTGPNDSFTRAGALLSDYCFTGKTLYASGSFVVYNRTATALELQVKIVRDNGQGGTSSDYVVSSTPSSANVPASGYGYITTPQVQVDCTETGTYFYSPQLKAVDSGSVGKTFSLVQAALVLQYQ